MGTTLRKMAYAVQVPKMGVLAMNKILLGCLAIGVCLEASATLLVGMDLSVPLKKTTLTAATSEQMGEQKDLLNADLNQEDDKKRFLTVVAKMAERGLSTAKYLESVACTEESHEKRAKLFELAKLARRQEAASLIDVAAVEKRIKEAGQVGEEDLKETLDEIRRQMVETNSRDFHLRRKQAYQAWRVEPKEPQLAKAHADFSGSARGSGSVRVPTEDDLRDGNEGVGSTDRQGSGDTH